MIDDAQTDQDRLFAEACDLLGDRITMAHAKDRDAVGAVVPAGAGIIDFDSFFAALDRIGFAGPVVTHGLAASDAAAVARFLSTKIRA
jgi:sugar phosphate isomerase/epimerase